MVHESIFLKCSECKKKTKMERALKPHIDTKHSRDIQESMPSKEESINNESEDVYNECHYCKHIYSKCSHT